MTKMINNDPTRSMIKMRMGSIMQKITRYEYYIMQYMDMIKWKLNELLSDISNHTYLTE